MEPIFNDWRLVALSPLPVWALALAGLGVTAAVWLAWRGISSEARSTRRYVLLGLRVLAAVLAFLLILEPGMELLATTQIRGRVAVLVDRSKSMTLPSRSQGPSREQVAATLLAPGADRTALEQRFQVEYFGFADGVTPMEPAALAAPAIPASAVEKTRPQEGEGEASPDGETGLPEMGRSSSVGLAGEGRERTRILTSLEDVAQAGGGRPLAGIVVITDGADNGVLDAAAQAGGERLEDVTSRLSALGAPVFALDTTDGELRDVALSDVRVDDFAFVRNSVEVEVEVSLNGYPALSLPVVLEREGQVVTTRNVAVKQGEPGRVTLSFTPDTTGEFAYTVRVPVQEGEAVTANNVRSFVLKVIRDRVRVLHVAGRPSWDERFLRMLLKRDPNVDLISFFILRTPSDLPVAGNDELSLIPFPTDEIFRKQLDSFDLVVFHNFNYRPYRMSHYLPGIAEYVKQGGAFLMLGGEHSFAEGLYSGTPIEDVLPVSLGPMPEPLSEGRFRPRLTTDGRRHPITALVPGEAQNETAWNRLPELEALNRTSLRQDAHALLEHPTLADWTGRPAPVVAVREVGRGRSMAITADSAWTWAFLSAREGQPRRSYDAFFQRSIRWLVRDPDLTHVRVDAEQERYSPEEPVALLVQARTRDYGPAAGARVDLKLIDARNGSEVHRDNGQVAQDGTLRLTLGRLGAGAYRAEVVARRGEEELGRAQDVFVVEEGGPELSRPAPRRDLLELVASATKGEVRPAAGTRLSELPLRDPRRVEIGQRKTRPLWDRMSFLFALCAVLGTEWFLRRRWGFF